MNNIHTILPGAALPEGYFDDDNITFIQSKITEILSKDYAQMVIVGRSDIIRTMQHVLEERRENIPKLNQRVIMYITADFRRHQTEVNKHLNWAEGYSYSQRLIDPIGETSKFDHRSIKTTDQKKYDNKTKVGGTLRFHFT